MLQEATFGPQEHPYKEEDLDQKEEPRKHCFFSQPGVAPGKENGRAHTILRGEGNEYVEFKFITIYT